MKHLNILLTFLLFSCSNDKEKISNEFTLKQNYSVKENRVYKKEKTSVPKNIILLIGDGMGMGQVQSALLANRGKLNLLQAEYVGLSKTLNIYNKTTDSGAGGTALATGVKTYNGAISVDTNKIKLTTLSTVAKNNNKSVGVVSSCEVVHATPASFLVNHTSRKKYEILAKKMLNADFDFVYGGGLKRFNDNLQNEFKNKGIDIIKSEEELKKLKLNKKTLALMTDGHPDKYPKRGEFLSKGVDKALELLPQNENGFFLMIEGSQIDWAGHSNEIDYMINETLDFDRVVGKVLDFAYKNGNTLVIVTADHETGGFSVTNSDMNKGYVKGKFTKTYHTETMVPVFTFGPKAENFIGVYENTEIFNKIKNILEIK